MSFTLFETLKTRTAQTRSLLQLPAPCVPPARCALAHRLPRPCTCLLNSLPSVSGPCLGAQSLPGPPSWTCPLLDAAPPLQVASPVLHACLALPLLLLVARTEPAVLRIGLPLPSDKRKWLSVAAPLGLAQGVCWLKAGINEVGKEIPFPWQQEGCSSVNRGVSWEQDKSWNFKTASFNLL